ncbi:secondary thiamine-phosphate synthase enzyme YjbQ [Poriferisphaera corsica]|nr:secondary thiamine-phosphate synthase enzyme YjbQ [Poriferisphaera corsica]
MHKTNLAIKTDKRDQMVEITHQVQRVIDASGIRDGYVIVYCPHTTAGITINENADPDVVHDMLLQLDEMVPWRQPFYQHAEGNSTSHVKATMTGLSQTVIVENGRMILGTWQGIYFCEYDGPRNRTAIVSVFAA